MLLSHVKPLLAGDMGKGGGIFNGRYLNLSQQEHTGVANNINSVFALF